MSEIDFGLVAMVLVLGTTAVWSYLAFKANMPKSLAPFGILWSTGFALGAYALVQGTESRGSAITAVALGGMLLFFLSTGRQKSGGGAIAVGDRLPEFSAPDENGDLFHSSSLAGSAVVLKIFRGHW